MLQSLTALLGATATVAACYAAGVLLLDRLNVALNRLERLSLGFLTGAACLHLVLFAIFALHLAYWPVVMTPLAVAIAAAVWTGAWRLPKRGAPPLETPLRWFLAVAPAPFTILYFFHALAPESSSDGYHLALVARYLRVRGFEAVPSSMFASLSMGVEMLFAPAFIIGRHSAAALVHFAFLIALALAILAFGIRLGKPWVGAAAALLTYLSPVVGLDGSSAYNDVAAAAVVFGVFYWLEIWDLEILDKDRRDALLIPAGLLAGFAYAVKYSAFVVLPFALVLVLLRTRKWRGAALLTACSLTMVLPWMAKDWIYVGDPVAPFGSAVFANPNIHIDFEQALAKKMSSYDVASRWSLPLEAAVRGAKTSGVVGPIFLLAPLMLLTLRQRLGRWLAAAALLLILTYLANVGTRFLIPAVPFLALGIALALERWPRALMTLVLIHAAASWPSGVALYADAGVWRLDRILWKEALRIVPQDRFLRNEKGDYPMARAIETLVPKGEKVLNWGGPVAIDYTSREILGYFDSASNETLVDMLNVAVIEDWRPVVVKSFRFATRSLSRLRLTGTGEAGDWRRWSVNELRFYRDGVELPRDARWRLQARPNPWDVQMAFDNSDATRWRTWQPPDSGMSLEVDFGSPVELDEARVETSDVWSGMPMRLEAERDGKWAILADHAVDSKRPAPPGLRRQATNELHRRGVNYLLLGVDHYAAEDIREDPEAWGLKQVAEESGGRLYQVVR